MVTVVICSIVFVMVSGVNFPITKSCVGGNIWKTQIFKNQLSHTLLFRFRP